MSKATWFAAVLLGAGVLMSLAGCGGDTHYMPDAPPRANPVDNGPLNLKLAGRVGEVVDDILTYRMDIGEAGVLAAQLGDGLSPSGSPWWGGTSDASATLSDYSLHSLRGQVAIAERQGECIVTVGWDNLQSRIKIIVSDEFWPEPTMARNVMGQQLIVYPFGTKLPIEGGFATLHLAHGANRKMTALQVSGPWWQGKIVWEVPQHGSFTAVPRIAQSSTIGRTDPSRGRGGYLVVSDDQLAVSIKLADQ